MSFSLLLEIIQVLAVVLGIAFGLDQLRQLRRQREAQAVTELLRSLQAPDIVRAAMLLFDLPDDLTGEQLQERLGDDWKAVMGLLGIFESLGPVVARGHIPIQAYEDVFRGGTVVCWKKLRRYVENRRAGGWSNFAEWFQWLAERMEERAPLVADIPAHERFRSWRSPTDFARLRDGAGEL